MLYSEKHVTCRPATALHIALCAQRAATAGNSDYSCVLLYRRSVNKALQCYLRLSELQSFHPDVGAPSPCM
jgi:hypothetical protein